MYQVLSANQRDCAGDREDVIADKLKGFALAKVQD